MKPGPPDVRQMDKLAADFTGLNPDYRGIPCLALFALGLVTRDGRMAINSDDFVVAADGKVYIKGINAILKPSTGTFHKIIINEDNEVVTDDTPL